MNTFSTAVSRIIKEQQSIIGPIAIAQAKKVSGLQFSNLDDITIVGDNKKVLGDLVGQYSKLFGQASIEVCKEALAPLADKIPSSDLPDILKN